MTLRSAAIVVIFAVLAVLPEIALACPVCTGGQTERVQMAFLSATLFMTLLPLCMIAGGGYLLWRRLRRLDAEDAADSIPR